MTRHAPHPGTRPRRLAALLAAAATLGLGAWGMAHSRTQTATRTETPTDPAGAAGMRAAIDPETGQLGMPTPEQQAVLEKALADVLPPAAEPVLRRQADGSLLVDLNGHGINYHVARRGPDGRLRLDCVESGAKVQRVLQSPPPVDANGWEVQ